ncbi:unnamed protein product [Cuscuta campestris]|uniref:Uncharacterized protein n=2 Tax=Cuscuta sect. Cleistogrammica TaxID=1824901 RepID=A0A484L2H0_9ASTE|nr:hypothetical protein DM860_011818 [Cuscuta australis]VFQ70513.1 unnamed protein product [Cuscuta campestris]
MGKHGPCYHCGVTSTPLWRNGPPEKPILCNACGSRWRTKGTLANYTPLHARADTGEFEDYRASRVKTIPPKTNEAKFLKRKQVHDYAGDKVTPDYSQFLPKGLDEDTSNRSSSGSAISNSESCAQFSGTDFSDLTGPTLPNSFDMMVPSKKRTCVGRPKPSPVEKLTKDLCSILQEQQCSYFSGSSEEDLLFESDNPMVSVEIGHGSVLIRHPSSLSGKGEDSEASSLSVDNKQNPVNEAYSPWTTPPPSRTHINGFKSPSLGTESIKRPTGKGVEQELVKRNKDRLEKLQMLGHHTSPLCNIDLKDIVNFEVFTSELTTDEQQKLLKYLPSVDTSAPPDSFICMFESSQFKEDLSCFQKLLAEGVFDNSFSGATLEDRKKLKRFVMCYLTKSKWVEEYNLLKDVKSKVNSSGSEAAIVHDDVGTGHSMNVKRSLDGHRQKLFPVPATTMKCSERLMNEGSYGNEEKGGSLFTPKCLFPLPPSNSSPLLESSDQDLLLDVPSNTSFPQAELLLPS